MYNPTASQARAAAHILQRAEEAGHISQGSTILDASSGNTGIAYAALAATKGYHLKLCLPKNVNPEKKRFAKSIRC